MTGFLLPKVRKRPRRLKPNDDAFRAWIQTLPSCISGRFSEYVNGEGRNLACHVRRAGRSGTAYKALYSCVPMTNAEHQTQHQHGEAACLNRHHGTDGWPEDAAKAWFDLQARYYRDLWMKIQKAKLLT